MLSLLKNLLKSYSQKTSKTPDEVQNQSNNIDVISHKPESDFAGLWQAAEREARVGNKNQARTLLYQALEIQPDSAELLCQIGHLEKKLELYEDAKDNLLTAIHLNPNMKRAYIELGDLSIKIDALDDAMNFFQQALQLDPHSFAALCGIGNLLTKKEDFDNAIQTYEAAIELAPDHAFIYSNLGHCLTKSRRYHEAVTPLKIAQALDPNHIESYINLNFAYYSLGQFGKAYKTIRKALAVKPDNEVLHWCLSWSYLLFEHFDKAWMEYEYRFSSAGEVEKRIFPFPFWQGEDLSGKTIFVAAEQGLGDQIMFASCLPELSKQAKHCIVECDKKLVGLFQDSFSDIQVFGTQSLPESKAVEKLPTDIDFYIHIGSLPRWFRTDIKHFFPAQNYLKTDPTRIEYWLHKLSSLDDKLKVGISWRGGVKRTRNYLRTIPLQDWQSILQIPGVAFINLQYGDCQQDLQEIENQYGVKIHDWSEAIADYRETAALITGLDLVISVCTSAIHLSGALGQKTWVLVPLSPEWRYLAHNDSLPWYQRVSLFRQTELNNWQPVMSSVARKLSALTENKKA